MNKQILILIIGFMSLVLVSASVTFAVIHVTTSVSVNEPLSDTSFTHYYGFLWAYSTLCFNDSIINNAGVSLDVNVEWIEIPGSNVYGMTYTTNMPFNQTINPGINYINSCVSYTGGAPGPSKGVSGITNITRI